MLQILDNVLIIIWPKVPKCLNQLAYNFFFLWSKFKCSGFVIQQNNQTCLTIISDSKFQRVADFTVFK